MNTPNRLKALQERVARCQESVSTFMRIQEELLALRSKSAIGFPQERIGRMIKLNRETLDVIKRSLTIAENELERATGSDSDQTI